MCFLVTVFAFCLYSSDPYQLWYLKDVAAHSVDSDIFYVVINLSAGFKSYIITFIS